MEHPRPRAEREARRALLQDALQRLGERDDADRAAYEAMRALDAYLEVQEPAALQPVSSQLAGDGGTAPGGPRVMAGVVIGGAVIATIAVAVAMSGGVGAGIAVAAIWIVTLALLLGAGG